MKRNSTSKKRWISVIAIVLCLNFLLCSSAFAATSEEISADQRLRATGMPQNEIDALDPDIKDYIASTLSPEAVYVESSNLQSYTLMGSESGDTSLATLTCPTFRKSASSNIYELYPTYETKSPIKPRGNDLFGFCVGNGLGIVPNSFSGLLWYKHNTLTEGRWQTDASVNTLHASESSIYGYAVKGAQLGSPSVYMNMKACCHFDAKKYSQDATMLVNLKYVHDTSGRVNYSISLNMALVSIGFSSNQTAVREVSKTFDINDSL